MIRPLHLREPDPEPYPEAARPVLLANPRWDRDLARAGDKAVATVDAVLPEEEWRTRVVFTWLERRRDGTLDALGAADGHILRGKAWALFRIPGPGDGSRRRFLFKARHSLSAEVEGPVLEAEDRARRAFDGMLLYSPSRGDYLLLADRGQAEPWLEEIREVQPLKGGTRRAWEIRDAAARLAALSGLAREAGRLFDDQADGGGIAPQLEELLVLAANPAWDACGALCPWVYVRDRARESIAPKHAWRRPSDAGLQEILDGLSEPAPGTAPCLWLGSGIRQRLLRSPPVEGRNWDWHPANPGPANPDAFRFGARAALTRCLLGWDGKRSAWDFRGRRATFGGAGQAGFAIPDGSLSGTWHWPDADGVDMLEHLHGSSRAPRATAGRECRLRSTVEAGGNFLADVPVPLAMAFPALEAVAGLRNRKGSQGPKGSKGPQGPQAACTIRWAWSSGGDGAFEDLPVQAFHVKRETGKRRGEKDERALRIEWRRESFRFTARGGLAASLGCGAGIELLLAPGPGADLIGHLLHGIDFHRCRELDPGAYRACVDIHRARLTAGKAVGGGWTADRAALRRAPPESLAEAIVDRMRSRESEALEDVVRALKACRNAAGTAGCHKLRWVIRHVSGAAIPPDPDSRRAAAKRRGLVEGLRRIRGFAESVPGSRQGSGLRAELEAVLTGILDDNPGIRRSS